MRSEDASSDRCVYELELLNDDLATLIEAYEGFEARLLTRIVKLFLTELEGSGGVPRGSLVVCAGIPYQLAVDAVGFERELHLHVTPCGTTMSLSEAHERIDHFGRIRSVYIHWPDSLYRSHEGLPERIRRTTTTAYSILHELFVDRFSELEQSLFTRLYEILNVRILEGEKPHLLNRSWLTVTTIESAHFQYFFSQPRLNHVVRHLIAHQVPRYSPFELLACLVAEDAADTFWERGLITPDRFSALQFQNLSSVAQQPKHWLAESNLYQDGSIAAREVCTVEGYCLLLNCPAVVAEELQPLATLAVADIANQFKANLKKYRKLRKAMNRLTTDVRRSGVYGEVKDVMTTTVAKFMAEFMKS